mgnify:CR=1 FL=1
MTLTKTDQKKLKSVEKALDKDIKLKYREGLSKTFGVFGLKGIAREIKAGRNVRSNVILGVQTVHGGPRYNLDTKEVTPQSKKSRELEHKLIYKLSEGLVLAGESPLNKEAVIKALRAKDRAAEKRMRDRK